LKMASLMSYAIRSKAVEVLNNFLYPDCKGSIKFNPLT
jgi:hypothetical protein